MTLSIIPKQLSTKYLFHFNWYFLRIYNYSKSICQLHKISYYETFLGNNFIGIDQDFIMTRKYGTSIKYKEKK